MERQKVHSLTDRMRFTISSIQASEASKDKAYVELILLHSYPAINGNGVTIMPKVLKNSVESLKNSPLDIDHEMEGVWFWEDGDNNRIVGSITEARLEPEYVEGMQPEGGYQVVVKAVLWKRLKDVKAVVQDIQDNTNEWKASFEIAPYSIKDQIYFYHDGKLTKEEMTPTQVRDAWEWGESYNGSPVALAFGGESGVVDFYGAALTLTPADENTRILNLVANTKGAKMNEKELAKELRSLFAEEQSKYEGYVSPEDLAKAVDAAKAEVEAKFEGYISAETLSTEIAEAKEAVKTQYETFIARMDSMREKDVLMTEERKTHAFEASQEDFDASLSLWVSAMQEMVTELESANVEVTEEIKENIATWNGKEDERFKVVLATLKKEATVTIPNSTDSGEKFSFYN